MNARTLLGLALAVGVGSLIPTVSAQADSRTKFRSMLKSQHASATSSTSGTDILGQNGFYANNTSALGRDANGRNAKQFDNFLSRYTKKHGTTPPTINSNTPGFRVQFQQNWILNRYAIAASQKSSGTAGGVFFGSGGTPVSPVSSVNIFNYFPVFTQFGDYTGFAPATGG